jgi:hypothetical protein
MYKKLKAITNETESASYLRSAQGLAIATAESATFKKQVKRENVVKKIK